MNRDPTPIVPTRVTSFRGPRLSVAFEALDASRSVGPRGAARAPRMVAAADVVPDDPLKYRDQLAKAAGLFWGLRVLM